MPGQSRIPAVAQRFAVAQTAIVINMLAGAAVPPCHRVSSDSRHADRAVRVS